MSAEDFFSRWEKKNRQAQEDKAAQAPAAPEPAPDPYEGRAPTQEDLEQLTPQADFSPFMKQGVDEGVKRSALKKLFSDPHFNIMDGLDIYIDDYSKPDPIPPAMLAMLEHAKGLLNPEVLLNKPMMSMRSEADEAASGVAASEQGGQAAQAEHGAQEDADAQTELDEQAASEAKVGADAQGASASQAASDAKASDAQASDAQAAPSQRPQVAHAEPGAAAPTLPPDQHTIQDQAQLAPRQSPAPASGVKPTSGNDPETETGKS